MNKRQRPCMSKVGVGDDYADNSATFRCQLRKHHRGAHREVFRHREWDKEFEKMITAYDASIAYVDHHIGIIMDELERQGVLEDAVLIVTSDHGDAFGEHGVYSDHVMADECINRIMRLLEERGVVKG